MLQLPQGRPDKKGDAKAVDLKGRSLDEVVFELPVIVSAPRELIANRKRGGSIA